MKKKYEETLTSERLRKRFNSQFDLVSHAIHMAEDKVRSDKDMSDSGEYLNCANEVLREIARGDDILVEPVTEEETQEVEVINAPEGEQQVETEEPQEVLEG